MQNKIPPSGLSDLINRDQYSVDLRRFLRLLLPILAVGALVCFSPIILGLFQGERISQAWYGSLGLWFLLAVSCAMFPFGEYWAFKYNSPRLVQVSGTDIFLSSRNSTIRLDVIGWKLGSATSDTMFGWMLEDRECVLIKISDNSVVALGYSDRSVEEWSAFLEMIEHTDGICSGEADKNQDSKLNRVSIFSVIAPCGMLALCILMCERLIAAFNGGNMMRILVYWMIIWLAAKTVAQTLDWVASKITKDSPWRPIDSCGD